MNIRIVVGVDGSVAGDAALDWAVEEAATTGGSLHLVYGYDDGWGAYAGGFDPVVVATHRESVLSDRIRSVARADPRLRVTCEMPSLPPAAALVDESRRAGLLVVGGRGRSPLRGALLGSVSRQVASHAHCPVVVVHDDGYRSRDGGILAGIDWSPDADRVLEIAFARAERQRLPLTVLHASWAGRGAGASSREDREGRAWELLSGATEPWEQKFPDVRVRRRVAHADAVEALVVGSTTRRLLVIGTRGAGGFAGLLLGSVSHRVLQRARCPVMVVGREGESQRA